MPIIRKRGDTLYVEFKTAVNLTGKEICLYDNYGNMPHIRPNKVPEHGYKPQQDEMVIVNNESEGIALGIKREHIVIPRTPEFAGRKGVPLTKLDRPLDEAVVVFSPDTNAESAEEYWI